MSEASTVTDCEWEFIGEGYDPAEAGELCADGEEINSELVSENSGEDKAWEYWYG